MNNQVLLDHLRVIPNWPIKGVNFRDVTTLFKSPECIRILSDEMYNLYKDKGITKIVGIESRGFVMSSALAYRLGTGIVLCRKPGKLPCETVTQSYAKEYGIDTIEIHKDAINENDIVLPVTLLRIVNQRCRTRNILITHAWNINGQILVGFKQLRVVHNQRRLVPLVRHILGN